MCFSARTNIWNKIANFLVMLALTAAIVLPMTTLKSVLAALEIGADEHYELNKALLWVNGYSLYKQVWNDQPPLFTVVLGTAFKIFGATVPIARIVAILFSFGLIVGCWVLARIRLGPICASASIICLLGSKNVFTLLISTMLEVPTIAVALFSILTLFEWKRKGSSWLLVLSGFMFAVALQIKLTSIIVAPAIATEIILISSEGRNRIAGVSALTNLTTFWVSMALTFVSLGFLLGSSYNGALLSHFRSPLTIYLNEERSHVLSAGLLSGQLDTVIASSLGVAFVVIKQDVQRLRIPLIWLSTGLVMHIIHRPWWDYYWLHFAVPLAWLSGYAISELIRMGSNELPTTRSGVVYFFGRVVGAILAALLLAFPVIRLSMEVRQVQTLEPASRNAMVMKMKSYAPRVRWVYSTSPIYSVQAGLLEPPEIAVLPLKRFWSGSISQRQILSIVQVYRPELLLFDNQEFPNDDWKRFIDKGYRQVAHDAKMRLFVVKTLL